MEKDLNNAKKWAIENVYGFCTIKGSVDTVMTRNWFRIGVYLHKYKTVNCGAFDTTI
jgi:hypothetical protein